MKKVPKGIYSMKIAVIEDDLKIRNELCQFLSKYGYDTYAPTNFENLIVEVMSEKPQLILLDINLPVFDGYYFCREIRKISDTPIIIVTSRDSEADELISMNLGADDFVTKPYNTQILLARISSLLNRVYRTEPSNEIVYKDVTLDISKSIVSFKNNEVELTKNEVRILNLLMKSSNKIISRDEIMNALWQSDEFVDDNTLTVNINRLRKKLEEIGVNDFLITKRGQGYMV